MQEDHRELLQELFGSQNMFEIFLAQKGMSIDALPPLQQFLEMFEKDIRKKICKQIYPRILNIPENHLIFNEFRPIFIVNEAYYFRSILSSLDPLVTTLRNYGFGNMNFDRWIKETVSFRLALRRSYHRTVPNTRRVFFAEVQDHNEGVTRCMRLELTIGSEKLIKRTFNTANVRVGWNVKIFEYTDFADILELMLNDFWHFPVNNDNDADDDGDD